MDTKGLFSYIVVAVYLSLCITVFAQNVQEVVEIPDPNLERAIRQAMSLPNNQAITYQRILRLTKLDAKSKGIQDLTGLEHATALKWLHIGGNNIRDLSALTTLTRLELLHGHTNPITSIYPLSNLTQLKDIDFGGCRIRDLSPLQSVRKLTVIRIHYNQLEDIGPLDIFPK